MRLPIQKPKNYSEMSLPEKAAWVKYGCDQRIVLDTYAKLNLFGTRYSAYIALAKRVSEYLEKYLENQLDEILPAVVEHAHNINAKSACETFAPSLAECMGNSLNDIDIEFIVKLLEQNFLTNVELTRWISNTGFMNGIEDKRCSPGFKLYFAFHRRRSAEVWCRLFPTANGLSQTPSEKIHPYLKASLGASAFFSLFTGFGLGTAALLLTIGTLYSISGELSDNIAYLAKADPKPQSKRM